MREKWAERDVPEQKDRVAVVTGANSGLGFETARILAVRGASVVLAVRDVGTNHLGHFALTGLLLDRLLPVPGSRVVTVSSNGHRIRARIHFDDLQWERSYDRTAAYGQSKLANLMFTYELQRRLAARGTTIAVAAHPGLANTNLVRNSPAALRLLARVTAPVITQTPAMGALPILRAATDPGVLGGQYHGPDGRGQARGYPRPVTSQHAVLRRRPPTAPVGRLGGAHRGDLPQLTAGRLLSARTRPGRR